MSLTWNSAGEWDSAVSESGVVHESWGDHTGERIDLGYPSFDRGGTNLQAYWPLDEDSGSTANDVSGNGHDGTLNGPTVGQTGIFGTTSYNFNSSNNEYIDTSWTGITGTTARTWNFWFKSSDDTKDQRMISYGSSNTGEKYDIRCDNGNGNVLRVENEGGQKYGSTKIADGQWHMCTVVFPSGGSDVQDHILYVDGSQETNTGGGNQSLNTGTNTNVQIGRSNFQGDYVNGNIDEIRAYNRELSSSEVQALYDATSGGYLTSGTKSFDVSVKPDLDSLNYSLNGESITVDVIGSPGHGGEETQSVSLGGSSSYDLHWNGEHREFRVKPQLSTASITSSPSISSISLSKDPDDRSDLLCWWPLHQKSGDTFDLSGHKYHGYHESAPVQNVAGKGGLTATWFDGSDDALQSDHSVEIPQQYTLACWIKGNLSEQSGENNYHLGWDRKISLSTANGSNNTRGGILIRNAANDGYHSVWNGDNFLDGDWHHMAATVDRESLTVRIYMDGGEIHSESIPDHYDGSRRLRLGSWTSSYGHTKAVIGDARFYRRVLSSNEIETLYEWGDRDYARPPDSSDSGAVSRWSLDDDSDATTATDVWSSNDGTINGAGYTSTAIRGKALSFDGTDDYVSMPDVAELDITGAITVSCWVKLNDDSSHQSFVSKWDDNNGDERAILFGYDAGDSAVRFTLDADGTYTTVTNVFGDDLKVGNWYHLAGTFDGSSTVSLYLNGTINATGTFSNSIYNTPQVWEIGSLDEGADWLFNGNIDDVRIYDRELQQWEIHELYRWGTRGRDLRKLTVNI